MSEKINSVLQEHLVVAEEDSLTNNLYDKNRLGEKKRKNKVQYSLVEALYLIEKEKLAVKDSKSKELDFDAFLKKARKLEKDFWIKYLVYKDMRDRGYIVKTALKFGADFRVYDRGVKPGDDHAKWILYPVHESRVISFYEFSAKNRVAHSTRKQILLAVVDDEDEVTYYEVKWIRP